jgi:galactose mutarotase-like enzyme
MTQITIRPTEAVRGVRAIEISNGVVRVVVLPDIGAKIWQIYYVPTAADVLWNNAAIPPARQPLHASYDDTWSGGWDELFPNDAAGEWDGYKLPDHGELWTGEWRSDIVVHDDVPSLQLRFTTPLTHFQVEKTISLKPDQPALAIDYKLTNQGKRDFSFLFKLHPAFAVSADHRIDFPAMTIHREPEFPGTLQDAPLTFPWPHADLGSKTMDLRQVPDEKSGAVHFFYGSEISGGWCGVTNRATGLGAVLQFDPGVFTSCWLFATHGGWRDLNVAVLEPATGYPFDFAAMIKAGHAPTLSPGETLQSSVLFALQEGVTSIGGFDGNGRILPGEEM